MSNISTLNCPPAVYWWRTTETLVYGLPDLLSQKKNQLPFLKATIFLTSLAGKGSSNICSQNCRKTQHLLTLGQEKNICSHGRKTQRLLLFISCPHRQLRAQDAWPPQLPNTSISSLFLAQYKCSKVQILQFWNFLFINNCKYCWLSVQYRSQKFEIWYFLLHLYGLHYPRRLLQTT